MSNKTKTYYVVYQVANGGLDSDEVDFEYGEEVSQETVYEKVKQMNDGWYNHKNIQMVIAWSRIEHEQTPEQSTVSKYLEQGGF